MKNILYTYVVTTTAVYITNVPQSTLFIALWVGIDVVLAAGLGACSFFIVKSPKKKSK